MALVGSINFANWITYSCKWISVGSTDVEISEKLWQT
jgi:hypothetical protein